MPPNAIGRGLGVMDRASDLYVVFLGCRGRKEGLKPGFERGEDRTHRCLKLSQEAL